MLRVKKEIGLLLSPLVNMEQEEIEGFLEQPPDPSRGDLAFPCFILAEKQKRPPVQIAREMAEQLKDTRGDFWIKVENAGPYLNFFINYTKLGESVLKEILNGDYLKTWCHADKGRVMVIDYSAPNIAKPFGIGHLRSTVIGNALYLINSALGYRCVGVNHLGDWGTQFGKLMVAYVLWGEEDRLRNETVDYAYELYVRFHQEAKENPDLEEEARSWFKRLEDGESEAAGLWDLFCSFSLKEFKRIYSILGIDFDYYHGESHYNPYLDSVLQLVQDKGIARISEGALIVDLEPYDLPPCILRKKDGATLYMTRDLAAAIYRYEQFKFDRMLYVVGSEQSLHFQQLFKVLELLGFEWANRCVHVPFGLIRFKEGRMSTREGNIILLREVIDRAISLSRDIIEEKNPGLPHKESAAVAVGLGAIKYGDLSNDRIKDIEFDWEKVLDFSGETAPYIQYAHARICSILRKAGPQRISVVPEQVMQLNSDEEKSLMKELSLLPEKILRSAKLYKPSLLARHLIDVAREFNRFYHKCAVLNAEPGVRDARLALIDATRVVLNDGLSLLGIEAPVEM